MPPPETREPGPATDRTGSNDVSLADSASRPQYEPAAQAQRPWDDAAGRRRRYRAARRMPVLSCGHHRDPDDPRHLAEDRPERHAETFGLTPDALRREANRLHAMGWDLLEIMAVLDVPAPERAAR